MVNKHLKSTMPDLLHQTQSPRAARGKKRVKALTERLWCLVEHYLEQLEKLLSQQPSTSISNTLAREIGALVSTLDRLNQLDCSQNPLTHDASSTHDTGTAMTQKRTRKTAKTTAQAPQHTEQTDIEHKRQQLLIRLESWAQSLNKTSDNAGDDNASQTSDN